MEVKVSRDKIALINFDTINYTNVREKKDFVAERDHKKCIFRGRRVPEFVLGM